MAVQISAQDYYNKFGEAPKRTTASGSQVQIPIKISLKDFENKFGQSATTPTPEPSAYEKIGAFIGNAVRNPKETIDKAGNLIGGNIVNTYKDTVLQGEADKLTLSIIEKNNKLLSEWEKKKKENPAKADFYNKQIQDIVSKNNELSSQAGGDIAKKTDKQLYGQALGTAVDIAGIIAPLQGLIKNAGKLAVSTAIKRYGTETFGEIFKEGSRVIGQQGVEEMLKKGGGKIGAEATDTIIRQGMESLGKQGLLKGDKLISMQGLKTLATNPFVAEGAAYGGAQGLSSGMQQNQSGLELAKSTAEGTVYGVVGGVALHTIGKIISGATRTITDSVSNKIAGKEAAQEARDTISAAEELLGHTLGRTEKVQITKAIFKGAKKYDITKNIINEADKAGVDLDTGGIIKSTEPTISKLDNVVEDIMDIPAQERISREIASTEDQKIISEKLKGLVPEKDIPVVSAQLKNIENPDDVSRIIDGFNPEAIKDELSLRIATTDNTKKIASLLKGQVPDEDIPALSQMMKGVEDEVTVKKMIDNANVPKPKVEAPVEAPPKMVERDMTEQEIATALAKKELSRYKETDSRYQANRKAVGMAYSSLKKRLEGNATSKELKKTRAYLESNYVGKKVTVAGKKGIVKKNSFGRPGVDFGDGKIKYFDADKVKSKKVTDKEVYSKIIDDARKELEGKKSIYSISTKISEPEKVAPVEKVVEPKVVDESPLLQEAKKYSTPEEFVKAKSGNQGIYNADYEKMIKQNRFEAKPLSKQEWDFLDAETRGDKVKIYRLSTNNAILPGDNVSVHNVSKFINEDGSLNITGAKMGITQLGGRKNVKLVEQWIPKKDLYQTPAGTQVYAPNGTKSLTDLWKQAQGGEKPIKETPKIKEKAKTEQKPNEPISTSSVVTKSKLSKTTLKDAIKSGIDVDTKDIPELATMNLDDQAERAMKLLSEHDKDFVEKVMLKEIDSPDQKLLPGSIYSALKTIAIKNNDADEVYRLSRMREILGLARRAGQEVKAFDARIQHDPETMMTELVNVKKEIVKKDGKDADKIVAETKKEMQDFVDKTVSTDSDLSKTINDIKC